MYDVEAALCGRKVNQMRADSIYGIVPPMVTPFDSLGEVDESGFRSDVHHLIEEAGVHGLSLIHI